MKKLIRYRIPVSREFPKSHPRKGEETFFIGAIKAGLYIWPFSNQFLPKIHTIRKNYELWKKRFEKIHRGEAVLDLYYWTGKPYASKTETFYVLDKEDGIGIQKLEFTRKDLHFPTIDGRQGCTCHTPQRLAKNDGLSEPDFRAWFDGADLSKPLVIIHFTPYRY